MQKQSDRSDASIAWKARLSCAWHLNASNTIPALVLVVFTLRQAGAIGCAWLLVWILAQLHHTHTHTHTGAQGKRCCSTTRPALEFQLHYQDGPGAWAGQGHCHALLSKARSLPCTIEQGKAYVIAHAMAWKLSFTRLVLTALAVGRKYWAIHFTGRKIRRKKKIQLQACQEAEPEETVFGRASG
eukprot:scaffold72545_cov20-Tisochrysis_lutea.AAC.1